VNRLTGLWYSQAKVEGTVLKATRNWDSNSSVVNGPHVEPGRTPFYVHCMWVGFRGRRPYFPLLSGSAP